MFPPREANLAPDREPHIDYLQKSSKPSFEWGKSQKVQDCCVLLSSYSVFPYLHHMESQPKYWQYWLPKKSL